jgi:hypothetical protein
MSGNRDIGVIFSAARADLEELQVRDTRARELDGLGGRGIGVQDGAQVTIGRSVLSDNRETGVAILDAEASLESVVVRGTVMNEDSDFGDGIATGAFEGTHARTDLASVWVDDSARVGVLFSAAGGSLGGSVVRGNAIAVDLELAADPDIGADNLLVDNGRNDIALGLALPPAPPVEPLE